MIQLYVLLIVNGTLDDSLKIEETRRNRTRVMVKFNKNFNFDEIISRQKKIPELCGNLITFRKLKEPNTVRVSDLANSCTREVLNLYFTNTKISDGGDLKSIKVFSYANKALIEFKDYSLVSKVMSRTHIICETQVKLEKYWGPIEEEYFLEEEELDQKEIDVKKDLIESSREKQKRKSIAALTTLKSFAAPPNTVDRTKLILSNIQENINIQHLEFYINLITARSEIKEINWSLEHKGKILIEFTKEIDINRVLSEFQSTNFLNNLNSKPIQIETVNLTRTLVVLIKDVKIKKKTPKLDSNEEEDYQPEMIPATTDLLDLYFVNKQRSGGGEVESIERKSARYWLVTMKDQRVIKEILSRKHIIDEKPIKVFPYFENFGLPYLFRPIFDDFYTSAGSGVVFRLKVKDERLRYFVKVKSLHKKLNEILSESNAVSRYNKQESNILYVNYVEKLETKVPYMERIWRLRVKESIEYFLQIYKYEKLTLSINQWSTLSKSKLINESIINRNNDEDYDGSSVIDADSAFNEKVKYVGNNCAILSINESASNVEIDIVGPNIEVDRFIVKIKDVICKAYFTFELEEKIIKFKTYLYECEDLVSKWLNDGDLADSDTEVTLASGRSNDSDSLSIVYSRRNEGAVKLTKSRKNTIDEFISKLERDHLDLELSYGKLFQELGYTFLSNTSQEPTEEDDDEYKEFNDRITNTLDDISSSIRSDRVIESQMDKIKYTLDDLRNRINDMRRKFRQFIIKSRRTTRQANLSEDSETEIDEDESEDLFKLCVYFKQQGKIVTFKVHRKCKVKELKQILFDKLANPKENSLNDMTLTYNNLELSNDGYTITDYGISDKSTITLELA
jgi:hypothetical protein